MYKENTFGRSGSGTGWNTWKEVGDKSEFTNKYYKLDMHRYFVYKSNPMHKYYIILPM